MNKDIKVGILGVGYVGFPLALQSAKVFSTVAYDFNIKRINNLSNNIDNNNDFEPNEIKKIVQKGNLSFSIDINDLKDCNFIIVTVPTPVDDNKLPDMSYLESACKSIASIMNNQDIIVFESTVYPGAIEDICVPVLEKNSEMLLNKDFYCGYSPERVNPGDKVHTIDKIIKVTSGSSPYSAKIIDNFYKSIIPAGTFPVSSIKVAEASKVIENTQRDINIAFVNELAIIFDKIDISIHEVLEASKTKWNFLDFVPGLVGGHCIGVDPHYLAYKAKQIGCDPRIILAGREINESMSLEIAKMIIKRIEDSEQKLTKTNILILGLSFKENCPDLRNSKIFDLINHLESFGLRISVFDPVINIDDVDDDYLPKIIGEEDIYNYQNAVFAVPHNEILKMQIDKAKFITFFDLKNSL
jgi:UDP-N-acetyl-D-glucosamine/UDP-N-acetyl-D-galactosamine dehydrogenase